jgi:DNA-binding response OmpR family regulator
VAEGDRFGADLAEYILRTEGFDVCVALDASQATLLFEERSPDLVVIDLLISGGAGFRLCRDFAISAGARILAIAAIEAGDEALSAGAATFLQKPFQATDLTATVRNLLDK